MIRNIIFDFVGVIADIDYKTILSKLSFKEKIQALRLFVTFKTNKNAKAVFDSYQCGEFSTEELDEIVTEKYPKSKGLITKLSALVVENMSINKSVLNLIDSIRKDKFNVYMLSNSTPETLKVMEKYNILSHFDDAILSTEINLTKPNRNIYEYTAKRFNIDPNNTFYVDDNDANLGMADWLGFKILACKNSNQAFHEVGHRFYCDYHIFEDKNEEEQSKE